MAEEVKEMHDERTDWKKEKKDDNPTNKLQPSSCITLNYSMIGNRWDHLPQEFGEY